MKHWPYLHKESNSMLNQHMWGRLMCLEQLAHGHGFCWSLAKRATRTRNTSGHASAKQLGLTYLIIKHEYFEWSDQPKMIATMADHHRRVNAVCLLRTFCRTGMTYHAALNDMVWLAAFFCWLLCLQLTWNTRHGLLRRNIATSASAATRFPPPITNPRTFIGWLLCKVIAAWLVAMLPSAKTRSRHNIFRNMACRCFADDDIDWARP